jgi:hypothetical protein
MITPIGPLAGATNGIGGVGGIGGIGGTGAVSSPRSVDGPDFAGTLADALSAASVSLRFATTVKNQAIAAYRELMNTPI